jgi:hypothetical protein
MKHLIIPIDSENYDLEYLNLMCMYGGYFTTHFIAMGNNSNIVLEKIESTDHIKKYSFPTLSYSYSKGINIILKKLGKDDIIALSDSWTYFSTSMFEIDPQVRDMNYNDSFLNINVFKEPSNMTRMDFMSRGNVRQSLGMRLNRLKIKVPFYPIIFVKGLFLLDQINGLEETLNTEASRSYLKYQLEGLGLTKIGSTRDGMILNHKYTYDYGSDDTKINKLKSEESLFTASNENVDWGNYKLTKQKDEPKTIVVDKPPVAIIKPEQDQTKQKMIGTKSSNIDLILVCISGGNMESVISSLPMLRELKNKSMKVDLLLTGQKINYACLIPESYYKDMYVERDLSYLDTDSYKHIIRTYGCSIKIQNSISCDSGDNKSLQNMYILNKLGLIQHQPNIIYPICNYDLPKKMIPKNTIFINIGGDYPRWKYYDNVISKLAKTSDITIILGSLLGEKPMIDVSKYKLNKNIISLLGLVPDQCAGIMRACDLVITGQYSDIIWLAYGVKCQTILIEAHTATIPNTPYITKMPKPCTINANDSIDKAQKVLDQITDTHVWLEVTKRI